MGRSLPAGRPGTGVSAPLLLPGATLGVMGGGQLGRMFVHAAQAMGYSVAVLDPDAASPAGAPVSDPAFSGGRAVSGVSSFA